MYQPTFVPLIFLVIAMLNKGYKMCDCMILALLYFRLHSNTRNNFVISNFGTLEKAAWNIVKNGHGNVQ